MKNKKVILAFSGGLDTTFCVLYLKEQGYDVITATINTGGVSGEELKSIEAKAIALGSKKHYSVDVEDEIYSQIIQYVIKMNGLYEGEYPLMCADRYVIAQEILKIAVAEDVAIVAHGSTSNGNDQVRFDASFFALHKDITILTPIKSLNITRDEEIEYLTSKGIEVDYEVKKYSINENVFGTTFSGSEIDEDKEPAADIYKLTKRDSTLTPDSYEYINIDFEQGLPVSLNGVQMDGLAILKELNLIVGKFGYGKNIYVGNCIIGIKGRILFEAPGLFALIEAHKNLEQYTLTKAQMEFSSLVTAKWSDLVYGALYYEPLVDNLETFTDAIQKKVNGTVKLKVELNNLNVVEVNSKDALINEEIATYAQVGSWSASEVNGFIKLYSLQQKIAKLK